jgi:hypothetical protein
MSLNVGDQECNSGKKYGQKGTLCGQIVPTTNDNNLVCNQSSNNKV